MWTDDLHENFVCFDTIEELGMFIDPIILLTRGTNKEKLWHAFYSDVKKCIEIFGVRSISLYNDAYLKYGDGLETFLVGFWVNLIDAKYNEGSIYFENSQVEVIENGYMFIRFR